MATWRSIAKMVFNLECWDVGDYDLHSEDVTYTWEYNTTSDILAIKESYVDKEKIELLGKWHAEAQLKVLANWYATYEGKDRLKNLLKEELAEET